MSIIDYIKNLFGFGEEEAEEARCPICKRYLSICIPYPCPGTMNDLDDQE